MFGSNSNYYGGYFSGQSGIYATGSNLYGIWASGPNTAGYFQSTTRGIYATGGTWAGYFQGNVRITGTHPSYGLTEMDHPFDPANKYLNHSFVVSPDMKNIYDGVVILDSNGEAEVTLPAWFEAINKDFRYQLTCIGAFAQVYIAEKVQNNRFKIAGGKPGMEISWQVTGIRNDVFAQQHRVQVEQEKTGDERGKYLHPIEHNVSESLGIGYDERMRMQEDAKRMEQENKRLEEEHRQAEKLRTQER